MMLKTVLLVTSFVPVVTFKVIARVGAADLAQAKLATALGLVLGVIQIAVSKRVVKHTNYLERAFLGFLAVGTAWVYLAPVDISSFFVDNSTALLYFVLFLTTLIPQLFGYDPFTFTIARQMAPERVWNTPQFRTINLHLTYFWSGIFLICTLSSWLGHGKPLFSIVVPLTMVLGIGLPAVRLYPNYYLKRQFKSQPLDASLFPATAKELITLMPLGFDAAAGKDLKGEIQFDLSGEGGGKMVLSISEGQCTVREGEALSPSLTIRSPADTWLKISRREINPGLALMEGLYQVEGDMNLLMKMGDLFPPPAKAGQERVSTKQEGRTKVLAVQGSPRPKSSNTGILLQEFLKGAESQGAQTEMVILKEKKIHNCLGCFTCWTKTPGVCIWKDDMPELLEKVRGCDILVYATPLYNWNMSSLLKAFQERLLPLADPHFVRQGGTYRHPPRYQGERKTVLVSTCGFPETSHFDGLRQVFRQMEHGSGNAFVGEILMPAAELLKQDGLRGKSQSTLQAAYRAGVEVVRDGRISKEAEAQIQKPLMPAEQMAEMTNMWWDSHLEGVAQERPQDGKLEDMRILLRGMAAVFNAQVAGNMKATIQFEVSGRQNGNWFLSIERGACTFNEGKVDSPTLTILTPSEVWLAISNGELDGQQAFMEGRYKAQGDMGLLMRMKSLFGSAR